MKLILRFAAPVMFALFVLLAGVVAATALPHLIIPLLTAAAVAVVIGVFMRITR